MACSNVHGALATCNMMQGLEKLFDLQLVGNFLSCWSHVLFIAVFIKYRHYTLHSTDYHNHESRSCNSRSFFLPCVCILYAAHYNLHAAYYAIWNNDVVWRRMYLSSSVRAHSHVVQRTFSHGAKHILTWCKARSHMVQARSHMVQSTFSHGAKQLSSASIHNAIIF